MNKIRSFFNRNRKMIILVLGGIVFLILIIQLMNSIAKINLESEKKQNDNNTIIKDLPTTSKITGETVDTETTIQNKNIIDEFVNYCNLNDIDKAYEMLTDDCKNILFNSKEEFKKYYYDVIFNEKKIINIKNYLNNANNYTYEVEFYNDALETGKATKIDDIFTDYITINGETGKININNFIDVKEMDESNEYANIKITVKQKEIYKDYEKFVVVIENKSQKKILLDTGKQSKGMYCIADNNVEYAAFTNEIVSSLLELPANMKRTYKIKYSKIYSPNVTTKMLVFKDIVADYEEYIKNPSSVDERIRISIDL